VHRTNIAPFEERHPAAAEPTKPAEPTPVPIPVDLTVLVPPPTPEPTPAPAPIDGDLQEGQPVYLGQTQLKVAGVPTKSAAEIEAEDGATSTYTRRWRAGGVWVKKGETTANGERLLSSAG
jgi:hypothetical protein